MTVLVSIRSKVPQWQIPDAAVAALRERFPHVTFLHATTREERAEGLRVCDVAYTWLMSAEELATAPQLKWVHSSAVAVETFCLPELFARGVIVSNSRGVQARPIAEHVLAVLLAFSKQIPLALEHQRQARWAQNEFSGPRLPWLLRGRTLGLIGVGTIGAEIARLAAAFGMRVVALRRRPDGDPVPGVAEVLPPARFHDLLAQSDAVAIAAPLTPETDTLLGRDALAAMKPGALLINVGRAKIVDTDALVDALHAGHLGGAALDVFPKEPLPADHPLWTCPNVILTPHTSGFRTGHWDEVIDVFSDNLRRFERGADVRFRVLPELGY